MLRYDDYRGLDYNSPRSCSPHNAKHSTSLDIFEKTNMKPSKITARTVITVDWEIFVVEKFSYSREATKFNLLK